MEITMKEVKYKLKYTLRALVITEKIHDKQLEVKIIRDHD